MIIHTGCLLFLRVVYLFQDLVTFLFNSPSINRFHFPSLYLLFRVHVGLKNSGSVNILDHRPREKLR